MWLKWMVCVLFPSLPAELPEVIGCCSDEWTGCWAKTQERCQLLRMKLKGCSFLLREKRQSLNHLDIFPFFPSSHHNNTLSLQEVDKMRQIIKFTLPATIQQQHTTHKSRVLRFGLHHLQAEISEAFYSTVVEHSCFQLQLEITSTMSSVRQSESGGAKPTHWAERC